jgi:hypothetical protein
MRIPGQPGSDGLIFSVLKDRGARNEFRLVIRDTTDYIDIPMK